MILFQSMDSGVTKDLTFRFFLTSYFCRALYIFPFVIVLFIC